MCAMLVCQIAPLKNRKDSVGMLLVNLTLTLTFWSMLKSRCDCVSDKPAETLGSLHLPFGHHQVLGYYQQWMLPRQTPAPLSLQLFVHLCLCHLCPSSLLAE